MRRISIRGFFFGVVLLAIALYAVSTTRAERAYRAALQAERQAARMEALRQENEAMKHLLTWDRAADRVPRQAPHTNAAPSAEPPLPQDIEPRAAAGQARRQGLSGAELQEKVEAVFQRETVDQVWSVQAVQQARKQLGDRLPQSSRLLGVDCRTTMCRVETAHVDDARYRDFLDTSFFESERAWEGAVMSMLLDNQPGGAAIAVTYLMRPGTQLDFDALQ